MCSTLLCSAQLSLALCFEYSQPYSYVIFSSRAVVRSLLSRQCGPGPNHGVDAICELSLLLVLSFAKGHYGQKPAFKNFHSICEVLPLKLSLVMYLLTYLFILLRLFRSTVLHYNYIRLLLPFSVPAASQNTLQKSSFEKVVDNLPRILVLLSSHHQKICLMI